MHKLAFLVASLQAGLYRICQPITCMSIFPYIHYMNKTSGMNDNDRPAVIYNWKDHSHHSNYNITVTSTFTLTKVFCAPNVRQDQ